MQESIRSTVLSRVPPWTLLVGTGVEKRQTFHHCHAAAIKLLVCRPRITYTVAAYRYEKAAVISEHHTHVDSFEVLQYYFLGSLSRCTSATLYNTVHVNANHI